jgi:hypothetical protein
MASFYQSLLSIVGRLCKAFGLWPPLYLYRPCVAPTPQNAVIEFWRNTADRTIAALLYRVDDELLCVDTLKVWVADQHPEYVFEAVIEPGCNLWLQIWGKR